MTLLLLSWGYSTPLPGAHSTPSALFGFIPPRSVQLSLTVYNGTERVNIKPGLQVSIILKKDQQSGKLTEGIVKDILTISPAHPHGIKVRLESGQVGRVKEIIL